jgi:hypothetical protein
MKKNMVIIKSNGYKDTAAIEQSLKMGGWQVNTIELAKGETLPQHLEDVGGILILGDAMNVYEQSTDPLKVYFNM